MTEQVKAVSRDNQTLMISIQANELQVGDKWNGRLVTAVEFLYRNYLIHFCDGGTKTMDPAAQMLVERGVDRIEAVTR